MNYHLLKPSIIQPEKEGALLRDTLKRCAVIEGDLRRCNADKEGAVDGGWSSEIGP